jgi:hypothetical protein
MKVAAGFDPGSGMIEQLRELAEAEPFVPFTVRLQTGTKLHVAKKQDIEFTHYGSPKIRSAAKHGNPEEFGDRKRWHIVNVDAIAEDGTWESEVRIRKR